MKFTSVLGCLSLLSLPFALAETLSYDTTYDASSGSLATVACSDGANGLLTRGFTTFGSLPKFPFIGGASAVTGWNSTGCGTCWQVDYTSNNTTTSINVLAIDVATAGFNVAEAAMNNLTNNLAVELGRITVTSTQVAASVCGL